MVRSTPVAVSARVLTVVVVAFVAASLARSEAAERAGETKTVKVNATIHVTEIYYPSGACSSGASVIVPIKKGATGYTAIVLDNGVETTVSLSPPFVTEGVPAGSYGAGLAGYNASAGSCSEVAAGYRARFQVKSATVTLSKKGMGGKKDDGKKGDEPNNRVGHVRFVRLETGAKGPALAQIFRDGRWRKLSPGDEIGVGDRIRTLQNAEMGVELDLGGLIVLDRGMEIKIQSLRGEIDKRDDNGQWTVVGGRRFSVSIQEAKGDLHFRPASSNPISVMTIKG